MRKHTATLIIINLLLLTMIVGTAQAYWVWTPETKKFINPKYAVKDTPKEQYEWAMSFYDAKDYKRAATEFEKLVKNYEYSEYAAKSQYYVGLSYEDQGKYYIAFQNYQKTIDDFPHAGNISEIIAREFNIGNIYASKKNPKVMGTDIMTSYDRAIEIYKKVVENEPFGRIADEAQFKMAATLKEAGRFDEATLAFQKILEDYPNSKLYEQARYEMANSAYRASLAPAYDAAPTDKALKAFEEFANTNTDANLTKEAQDTIQRLKNKAADKSFNTAEFYEKLKRYESAIIYYKDVIKNYPDSTDAEISKVRIEDLRIGNYSHKKMTEFSARKQAWIMPWSGKDKKASEVVIQPAPAADGQQMPEQAVTPDVASAKKNWWSFGLGKKGTAQPAPAAVKTPAKDSWWSFGLGKKDVAKAAPAEPVQAPAKSNWWSFGLGKKDAAKAVPVEATQTTEKKKWWAFGLGKKGTAATQASPEVVAKTEPAEAAQVQPPEKKNWWDLGLGKKSSNPAQPSVSAAPKKEWTPLNFDKKEVKAAQVKEQVTGETTKPAEAPKVSTKKSWWSFGLGKNNTDAASTSTTTTTKKEWTPLNFDKKAQGE